MTPPESPQPSLSELEELLRRHWGHNSFRTGQEQVVLSGAAGEDVLAILPTGGGKSICYQIPGLYRGGVCLVISPLVALMEDQVQGLKKAGIRADALTAALHPKAAERLLSRHEHGPGGFLFVAPERLTQPRFMAACQAMPVRTIAVDEAHCISQWGHAFRADYLNLNVLRKWHPKASWIALTATATPRVADHIALQLQLRSPQHFRMPMRRPNLSFLVQHIASKEAAVVDWARRAEGTAILYTRTRKAAEQMAELLQQEGISAAPYHAGMPREKRDENQQRWLSEDLMILACTTAFGMGIDKPNVRDIAHAHIPESPEGYVQEAGRAGRDGLPARAVLLLDGNAHAQALERVKQKWPTEQTVRQVLQGLANQIGLAVGTTMDNPMEVELSAISAAIPCRLSHVKTSVDLLVRAKVIELHPTNRALRFRWLTSVEDLNSWASVSTQDRLWRFNLIRLNPPGRRATAELNLAQWAQQSGGTVSTAKAYLKRWEEARRIQAFEGEQRACISFPQARPDASSYALPDGLLTNRILESKDRWRAMEKYLSCDGCRAQQLESWFETSSNGPCGCCDTCLPPPQPSPEDMLVWIGDGISTLELKRRIPAVHHDVARAHLEDLRGRGQIEWRESWVYRIP